MIDRDATLEWEAVEQRATAMFDLHHRERGLAWARQAWTYLKMHEMTRCCDSFSTGLVNLRLVALALVYDEYSKAAWNISKGYTPLQWATGMHFSQFALGKLCGLDPEPIMGNTDEEMSASTIEYHAMELRWEVCKTLVTYLGSVDALHGTLWYTRYDPEDPKAPNAFALAGSQNAALAYLQQILSDE